MLKPTLVIIREIKTNSVGLGTNGVRKTVMESVTSPITITNFRHLRSANQPQID